MSGRDSNRQMSSRDPYASRGADRDERRGGDRDRSDRSERDRGSERRRSRSPGHRGVADRPRDPRRGGDIDSYSTDRNYREREREDRYSGRDRRGGGGEHRGGDRDWDRDRGSSRRDGRRDDDRGPRRDNRDLFEDRRGGGGGGPGGGRRNDRGDRGDGGFAAQQRQKSPTPPPKKREPTPDLTDVVSVLTRKRRLTQWDIKPPGYENVTAEQAKLSGMFPLPGAPRAQPMDPSKLQAFMAQPSGSVTNAALLPSNSRQAKRLLVHNIPPSATEESVINFFNLHLNGLNVTEGSDPCISAVISKDRSFVLVEFKAPTDATMALTYDGLSMDEDITMIGNGMPDKVGLNIRRPQDYIVPGSAESTGEPGVVSSVVPDTPNKISISNIPEFIDERQLQELLVAFGELRAFILVKDTGTDQSRGVAFCEYVDPSATTIAVEALHGMELGDKHLKAQRASVGNTQSSGTGELSVNAMSLLAGTTSDGLEQGRVLQLLNMVTAEELIDNEEYEEICGDVKDECSKYGPVLDMKIPRPTGGSRQSAGVGKIFVKFDTPESASKALKGLAGRKFADRTVVTTYFSEENFEVSAW